MRVRCWTTVTAPDTCRENAEFPTSRMSRFLQQPRVVLQSASGSATFLVSRTSIVIGLRPSP
jgi:hypothetical protein